MAAAASLLTTATSEAVRPAVDRALKVARARRKRSSPGLKSTIVSTPSWLLSKGAPEPNRKRSPSLPPIRTSSPPPPASQSAPLPPISQSLPSPPLRESLPAKPLSRSAPLVPVIVSAPALPLRGTARVMLPSSTWALALVVLSPRNRKLAVV